DPIVSAGYRAGMPHAAYRRVVLQPGDAVLIEFGACIRRYSAPLMRTAALAPVHSDLQSAVNACRDGLEALLENMRPGMAARDAARRARQSWPLSEKLVWHGIYA